MSRPVKIVATLTAKPGREAALKTLIEGMIGPSRAEPGNLRYDLWRDRADPSRYVLDELYVDLAAVEAHRASPHFQSYLAAIGDLAERSALVLDAVETL